MTNAISLSNVAKVYRVGIGRARVREMVPSPFDRWLAAALPAWWSRNTFIALRDVSASIPCGAAVGVVGHNGAGKTTLLKVISGVTAPTTGTSATSGRLAALLDAIVGFHPELTGRENAYLLGSMLGIPRRAMDPRIDRAIDFAEIGGDLLDTPVKRYSAGMMSRLAFGVITAIDADILLVDEVLSVGDASFQRKCIDWLQRYREDGGTLVFVSHNLGLLRSMAERVLWIDHGHLVDDGGTDEVLARYGVAMAQRNSDIASVHQKSQVRKHMQSRGLDRWGGGRARVEEVEVEGTPRDSEQLDVSIRYRVNLESAVFCVGFVDEAEREVGAAASPVVAMSVPEGRIRCQFESLPLRPGIYFPVVAILSQQGRIEDRWKLDRAVVVEANGRQLPEGFGPVVMTSAWLPT
jgi:ABC-type polysaccharide/polyol phosphate transport system ATPase subunit